MSKTALIIGLGQIGMGYDYKLNPDEYILTHARACSKYNEINLIGGIDSNSENRNNFKREYNCEAYESIDSALKTERPDLIIISTPTQTHLEIIQKIYEIYSPKAILCEKPLAYNFEDANKIINICESNNTKLYVNYHRRSDPGVVKIKEMLNELPDDERVKGICWYSKGIYNNGSHFLNLLEYWLGPVQNFTIIQKGRIWQGIDPEPDVMFQFEKGEVVFLSAKEENYSHYTIELINSQGRLRYEKGGKNILWNSKIKDHVIPGYTILNNETIEIENGMKYAQLNVLKQIDLDINNKKANICNGKEALNALIILNKLKAQL